MTAPPTTRAAAGRVAIVGHGRFGAALGDLLTSGGYAVQVEAGSLAELVRDAGFVVVAVPVPAMREVFEALAPVLQPHQIVVDVGSVKLAPARDMEAVFGAAQPWIATHPLFGPASLSRGERPLRVVVCPSVAHRDAEERVSALFRRAGCEVVSSTADEHDQVMASTHALAFFVAKGLLEAGAPVSPPYAPPSYQAIVRTIETVRSDAGHLFSALHRENPHARAARRRLLDALEAADRSLGAEPEPGETGLAIPDLGARSPALREARELIDDIDEEIVALLGQRVELARQAARAKAALGEGVRDPAREHRLRASRRGWAADRALDPDAVDEVFQAIIRYCREVQHQRQPDQDLAPRPRITDDHAPGSTPGGDAPHTPVPRGDPAPPGGRPRGSGQ